MPCLAGNLGNDCLGFTALLSEWKYPKIQLMGNKKYF